MGADKGADGGFDFRRVATEDAGLLRGWLESKSESQPGSKRPRSAQGSAAQGSTLACPLPGSPEIGAPPPPQPRSPAF